MAIPSPLGTVAFNGLDLSDLREIENPRISVNVYGSDVIRCRMALWTAYLAEKRPRLYSAHPDYPSMFLQPYEAEVDGEYTYFDLVYQGTLTGNLSSKLPDPDPPSINVFTETIEATKFDGLVPFTEISANSQEQVAYTGTEYTFRYLSRTPILGAVINKSPAMTFEGGPVSNVLPMLVTAQGQIKVHSPSDTGTLYFLTVKMVKAGGSCVPVRAAAGVFWYEITETVRICLVNT